MLVFYGALTGNGDRPTRLFEVGLMVASAGAMWVYFKRKGWL